MGLQFREKRRSKKQYSNCARSSKVRWFDAWMDGQTIDIDGKVRADFDGIASQHCRRPSLAAQSCSLLLISF